MLVILLFTCSCLLVAATIPFPSCRADLQPGQFLCHQANYSAPCSSLGISREICNLAPGVRCWLDPVTEVGVFTRNTSCTPPGEYSFRTTLLLSIFAGFLGADQFYLGHYVLGLLKLFTCGVTLILYFCDIVLIAVQLVRPADNSSYDIDYYGPQSQRTPFTDQTYIYQQY